MNLELDLLELNALYVAVSNHVKKTQRDAENYPSDFFQTQATLTEMLAEKIQSALYEKCDELDINFESNEDDNNDVELESLKLQLAILNDELSHYVNKRDFTMANRISDQIEELEERIEELK
jgi:excinuclease UvrABC helicase subunit UvrB